jgi:hypothetical protein
MLLKIDLDTLQVLKRSALDRPTDYLAVGAGSVWLAGASISEIDPVTDKVVRTIPVGGRTKTPCGIAATQNAVWVSIGDAFCDTIGR